MLTINSLVFDYRDIDGDAAFGIRKIPVQLGRWNTIYLLVGLAVALVGVSAWLASRGFVSPVMPVALACGSAGLLFAVISRLRPLTISVFADLFLILPAILEIFA